MFTGLVAEIGSVEAVERDGAGARFSISAGPLIDDLSGGDSIAVSGACLTVAELGPGAFNVEVMNQTLELTALGELERGSQVNLEPALRASDRLGGHMVQGHIDATGTVSELVDDGFARRVKVELPAGAGLERYVVERGSITLDGVSLTVASLEGRAVEVSLIPETRERTTLGGVRLGSRINVEVDVIARHAERLLQGFEVKDGA